MISEEQLRVDLWERWLCVIKEWDAFINVNCFILNIFTLSCGKIRISVSPWSVVLCCQASLFSHLLLSSHAFHMLYDNCFSHASNLLRLSFNLWLNRNINFDWFVQWSNKVDQKRWWVTDQIAYQLKLFLETVFVAT